MKKPLVRDDLRLAAEQLGLIEKKVEEKKIELSEEEQATQLLKEIQHI